jgi:hypothetical protein
MAELILAALRALIRSKMNTRGTKEVQKRGNEELNNQIPFSVTNSVGISNPLSKRTPIEYISRCVAVDRSNNSSSSSSRSSQSKALPKKSETVEIGDSPPEETPYFSGLDMGNHRKKKRRVSKWSQATLAAAAAADPNLAVVRGEVYRCDAKACNRIAKHAICEIDCTGAYCPVHMPNHICRDYNYKMGLISSDEESEGEGPEGYVTTLLGDVLEEQGGGVGLEEQGGGVGYEDQGGGDGYEGQGGGNSHKEEEEEQGDSYYDEQRRYEEQGRNFRHPFEQTQGTQTNVCP